MSTKTLEQEIIRLGEKHDLTKLQELINATNVKALITLLNTKLGRNDFTLFWNYLLLGFDVNNLDAREKRFACVKCFLDSLLKTELTYKQTFDLITRLSQDLSTFSSEQLIVIVEHCMDSIRLADPKCDGWKDLLPATLSVLKTLSQFKVNSILMSSSEYYESIIKSLITLRWPCTILTPLADMFKHLTLTIDDILAILNKFCGLLMSLTPTELPVLSYQLFSLCSTATQILIPLLAIDKYFYRFYYKKLYANMSSSSVDFDIIERYSDAEVREAEETVLYHLNYCTQYQITESQMVIVLKNFIATPEIILTPFMLSAILTMSSANREPEGRLSTSMLLPFLRSVIKNNEEQSSLADYSVWARDTLQGKQVDLDQVFNVLIDHNKEGKDVITPGLVNLAFLLLKTKNSKPMQELAINFLIKFIRKRFIFAQGIVKKLTEWMIVEQDQSQYSECLTVLSIADTFTVSECTKSINYVFEFFLNLRGEEVMRMMSFILPILKLSSTVRDSFIEVLRKALCSCHIKTRHMGVYGFCMILKQLNNSNSKRPVSSSMKALCTQHTISGLALMSQATLGHRNNPERHFDLLTLEILGLLRCCFHESLEIRLTLYENLQRAIELNPKLISHVLQFMDWHFLSKFENEENIDDNDFISYKGFNVKFDTIVIAHDDAQQNIEVNDNIGKLILFISHCLLLSELVQQDYDTRGMRNYIKISMEKIILKELKFEHLTGTLTPYKHEMIQQELNFIEGIMANMLLTSKPNNENIKRILPLFREHQRIKNGYESLPLKKFDKKIKTVDDSTINNVPDVKINGVLLKKFEKHLLNIWDLSILELFLRVLHEEYVNIALTDNTALLRGDVAFVCYIFEVTIINIKAIRFEPEYKQLCHSRRVLKSLTDITKTIYERCIKRLPELWHTFDIKAAVLAAECFQECLTTANAVYKKKFSDVYVKGFDFHSINQSKEAPLKIHDVIDEFMKETFDEKDAHRIPQALLKCLEILYDNISYSDSMTTKSYTWLLKFCKENVIETVEYFLIHKLLFTQRIKTHSGAFFDAIAYQACKTLDSISDEDYNESVHVDNSDDDHDNDDINEKTIKKIKIKSLELKSITIYSLESCLLHLYDILHKQIDDIEHFIMRANNLNYKLRFVADEEHDYCLSSLRALERSICTQLVHISNTLLHLTNITLPMNGPTMENLIKLVMIYYNCLNNLAKHFLIFCAYKNTSLRGSKFDLLLCVVGKALPINLYALIDYIESNAIDKKTKKDDKKNKAQIDKALVLRRTKLLPKIILHIENFDKTVRSLSKKTNNKIANLLHLGTVRDFRIQTLDLKAQIERTDSNVSEIEVDRSGQTNDDETNANDSDNSSSSSSSTSSNSSANENVNAHKSKIYKSGSSTNTASDQGDESDEVEEEEEEEKKRVVKQPAKKNLKMTKLIIKPPQRSARLKHLQQIDDNDSLNESTPEDATTLNKENDNETHSQLLVNLEKINKRVKKRKQRESENIEPDVKTATPPQPKLPVLKRKRASSRKK